MNDDTIQDLKQFIAATMHQEFSSLKDDVTSLKDDVTSLKDDVSGVKSDIARLDKKIDDRTDEIMSAIGETTNNRFESVETDVVEHGTRLTKLESASS